MIETGTFRIGAVTLYRLQAGASSTEVVPQLGGMVHRIRLAALGDEGAGARELLDGPPEGELRENPWFRGRLLFPFNDRIPGGVYRWEGRTLRLPINSPEDGSALHGLVYLRPFSVQEFTQHEAGREALLRLSTRLTPGDFDGYPFDVTFEATYRLSPTRFTLELAARNTGEYDAPLAFGWHPYFRLGARIDDLELATASERFVPVDEALLPRGGHQPVAGTPFDFRTGRAIGPAPIDIALTAPADALVSLRSPTERIEIRSGTETFRYLQLFTHPKRRSIALEPVTAATNAFNLPDLGLRVLAPGERLSGEIAVTYHRTT